MFFPAVPFSFSVGTRGKYTVFVENTGSEMSLPVIGVEVGVETEGRVKKRSLPLKLMP